MRRFGAVCICVLAGCAGSSSMDAASRAPAGATRVPAGYTAEEVAALMSLSPLPALAPDPTNRVADDPRAAAFGQALFFDTRLSGGGTVSCASCHDPLKDWTDGLRVPERFGPGLRHVPSLWNVAYNRWYFWDGRADSLWSQALEPLENPKEHATTRAEVAALVSGDEAYRRAYEMVFGPDSQRNDDEVFVDVGKALGAYQRRIVSRGAPFDVFVEGLRTGDVGKQGALSASAQRGARLFVGRANCMLCHHGPNFTDGEFHDTGIALFDAKDERDAGRLGGVNQLLASPFNALGSFGDDPDGRGRHPTSFLVNNTAWRGHFKTPTLRNVANTAPYMHRGQLATLEDVVAFYSELVPPGVDVASVTAAREAEDRARRAGGGTNPPSHMHAHAGGEVVLVPLRLTPEERSDLVEFLRSLTGSPLDASLTRGLSGAELMERLGVIPGRAPASGSGSGVSSR